MSKLVTITQKEPLKDWERSIHPLPVIDVYLEEGYCDYFNVEIWSGATRVCREKFVYYNVIFHPIQKTDRSFVDLASIMQKCGNANLCEMFVYVDSDIVVHAINDCKIFVKSHKGDFPLTCDLFTQLCETLLKVRDTGCL
jgi:hypothetical protein